jgi:hypothetical protein
MCSSASNGCLGGLGGLQLLLEDLLHQLLLLNDKCSQDSLPCASGASRASIWSGDCAVVLGDSRILNRAQTGDLQKHIVMTSDDSQTEWGSCAQYASGGTGCCMCRKSVHLRLAEPCRSRRTVGHVPSCQCSGQSGCLLQ